MAVKISMEFDSVHKQKTPASITLGEKVLMIICKLAVYELDNTQAGSSSYLTRYSFHLTRCCNQSIAEFRNTKEIVSSSHNFGDKWVA